MTEFTKALWYAPIFYEAVPLLLLLIKWKRLERRYFIFLGLLIITCLGADITSLVAINHSQPTAFLLNMQDVLQFILLLLIYREFYLKGVTAIVVLATTYFGFEIVNSLLYQSINDFQTWTWAWGSVMFVGMAVGYFVFMFKKHAIIDLAHFAPTWINASIAFYFSFSLYLFIVAQYVFANASADTSLVFWGFHNLNNFIKNILFAVAIYVGETKQSSN
jgi:hypothetical protein